VRTEDSENIYLDVRPFGDNERDAIDSYLHEALETEENSADL
jgi:hypothetical protein